MVFRCMGAVFCGIGQAWAGEYQVTVEYSLPPLYSTASMTLNGTGSFTDPGSGSPILTIDLGSATINYLPGVIFGSFNGISLSYAGSTGEITGDWDVTNSFNPPPGARDDSAGWGRRHQCVGSSDATHGRTECRTV